MEGGRLRWLLILGQSAQAAIPKQTRSKPVSMIMPKVSWLISFITPSIGHALQNRKELVRSRASEC